MGESFIEQTKRKHANPGTEYEDYLIAGEIEHVKSMIEYAIKNNKNNITWTYCYDSYDSFTSLIDNLYNGDIFNVNKYFDSPTDVNIISLGGLADYFTQWIKKNHGYPPSAPNMINFDYIKRNLEKELYNLGCKTVRMNIGPKIVKTTRLVKKGSFFKPDIYEDVSSTVTEWLISISW